MNPPGNPYKTIWRQILPFHRIIQFIKTYFFILRSPVNHTIQLYETGSTILNIRFLLFSISLTVIFYSILFSFESSIPFVVKVMLVGLSLAPAMIGIRIMYFLCSRDSILKRSEEQFYSIISLVLGFNNITISTVSNLFSCFIFYLLLNGNPFSSIVLILLYIFINYFLLFFIGYYAITVMKKFWQISVLHAFKNFILGGVIATIFTYTFLAFVFYVMKPDLSGFIRKWSENIFTPDACLADFDDRTLTYIPYTSSSGAVHFEYPDNWQINSDTFLYEGLDSFPYLIVSQQHSSSLIEIIITDTLTSTETQIHHRINTSKNKHDHLTFFYPDKDTIAGIAGYHAYLESDYFYDSTAFGNLFVYRASNKTVVIYTSAESVCHDHTEKVRDFIIGQLK